MIETGKRLGINAVGIFTDYEAWDSILGFDYTKPHDDYNMKVWFSVDDEVDSFNFYDWYMGGWVWPNIKTFKQSREVCDKYIDYNYFD